MSSKPVRPHPLNLRPPVSVSGGVTASDPLQPGQSWTVNLTARPDRGTSSKVDELSRSYSRRFVAQEDGTPAPEEVLLRDGTPVVVTWYLCYTIASLVVMEGNYLAEHNPGLLGWDFEEWAIFSACAPSAFEAIVAKGSELMEAASGELGKSTVSEEPKEPPSSAAGA